MPITILGVEIDRVTRASALDHIESFLHHRQPHQVVTVNPEFVMRAQTDHDFRRVLNQADLALPDGAGLLWASRLLARQNGGRGQGLRPILTERVTGIDIISALCARAEQLGWSLYLLGGAPGVSKRAAARLALSYPKLRVAGAESGPLISETGAPLSRDQLPTLEAAISRIRHAKPDILLVAFGAPKQDRFIARYKHELRVPVMIGVGGAFDFLAGVIPRAPKFVRLLWLEWLWRLIIEPKRLGRIWTAVIRFPLAVLKERLR